MIEFTKVIDKTSGKELLADDFPKKGYVVKSPKAYFKEEKNEIIPNHILYCTKDSILRGNRSMRGLLCSILKRFFAVLGATPKIMQIGFWPLAECLTCI